MAELPEKLKCPRCGSEDVQRYGDIFVCFCCRASFPAPKAPEPFKPMRLFISYGHPESLICRRIMAALQDRGHQVWFDQTSIAHGQDWREQIADGIRQSDGVIACLSAHSVRDPGVSLDELSIAIGVRGGNIKTVLLGPERDVRPPASVCHIQYLDLSRWKEFLTEDGTDFTPGFQSWFDGKMAQLFAVVESDDSRQFVGQISAIRDKLHVNHDTSKQQALLANGVVGREWLEEEAEAWLDDPAGARLCVLYGEPGVGKSAFAAKYIHYNPRVAAGLFCEYDRPIYNDARTVTMTLAYLLACRLPDYRLALTDILEQEKRLGDMNGPELFDRLLATPLTSLVIGGGHQTLCIVIDGLDECARGERNALAEVLAQYAPRLPAWLRILVTAREVSAVTGPLEGAFSLRLQAGQARNMADVRQYLAEQLDRFRDEPGWDSALDALAERSGGIFLYAALMADGIRQGKASLRDADAFPAGLSGAFARWFGWFFPDQGEYERAFRLPLGMLLAAPAPLPKAELRRIFGWDENSLNDFMRRVKVLLRSGRNDFGEDTLSFSHQYLSQWLDTPAAERFRTSRSAALEQMASRFCQLFRADPSAVTPYETVHLLPLLEQSGQSALRAQMAADHDLLLALVAVGDRCYDRGRLEAAMDCFEQARGMARGMIRQDAPLSAARDVAGVYLRIADILRAKGYLERALALYEGVVDLLEQMALEHDESLLRRDLAIGYEGAAGILADQGQPGKALPLYEKALALSQKAARQSDEPQARRDLLLSCEHMAAALQATGQLGQALALYEQALDQAERSAQPDDPRSQQDLALACRLTAGLLTETGQPDRALALYERAAKLLEPLARQPDRAEVHQHLGAVYDASADILERKWRLDEALALCEKAMAVWEQLAAETDMPAARRYRSKGHERAAGILQRMGRLDEALAHSEQALAAARLLAQQADAPAFRRDLCVQCTLKADILMEMDRAGEALGLYEQALSITEKQARRTGTLQDKRDWSVCCDRKAAALTELGRLDEALALYDQALALAEQIARQMARQIDAPQYQYDLVAACISKADVLLKLGRAGEAGALCERALALAERLAKDFDNESTRLLLSMTLYRTASAAQAPARRTAYARRGLQLAQQLLRSTGSEQFRELCQQFHSLLDGSQA